MSHYIGIDRRQGERRALGPSQRAMRDAGVTTDRRQAERRQEALSGVIAGLTAEQMQELAMAWKAWEASAPTTRKGA